MADEVEVTERGEIVAHGQNGDVWVYQRDARLRDDDDDSWWVAAEEDDTRLTRDGMLAFCRRVLREVDPDPVPTVDEAAIRADERESVAAMIESMAGELSWRDHFHYVLRRLAADIRAGKHRSTT